ncbi:MAG TPA: nitroreductase family protein [Planctomycetota bacterium]|nr:nitroreductase family protein [Planctomycetota bacterium]
MSSSDELLNLLRTRRSVRRFRPEPVERALLEKLVEAACWAPSAGNRQDWLFTVVTSPEVRGRMAEAVREKWRAVIDANRSQGYAEGMERYVQAYAMFPEAPAVVIVSARVPGLVQQKMYGDETHVTFGGFCSGAMAAQNLMLAAEPLGLATCCMTGALVAQPKLAELAGLGRKQEIVCLVAVGRAAGDVAAAPARKPVAEIARFIE